MTICHNINYLATVQCSAAKPWITAFLWMFFDPKKPAQHCFRERKPNGTGPTSRTMPPFQIYHIPNRWNMLE